MKEIRRIQKDFEALRKRLGVEQGTPIKIGFPWNIKAQKHIYTCSLGDQIEETSIEVFFENDVSEKVQEKTFYNSAQNFNGRVEQEGENLHDVIRRHNSPAVVVIVKRYSYDSTGYDVKETEDAVIYLPFHI